MKPPESVHPDPRWQQLLGGWDDLKRIADSWEKDDRVAPDIARILKVACDLFVHSYFKYEFATVATAWSLLALEATLRDCLGLQKEDRIGLKVLIGKAQGRGWLSAQEANALHAGRELRDQFVHAEDLAIYTPAMAAELLAAAHAAISDLYGRSQEEAMKKPRGEKT
jgi:hypothetical protein